MGVKTFVGELAVAHAKVPVVLLVNTNVVFCVAVAVIAPVPETVHKHVLMAVPTYVETVVAAHAKQHALVVAMVQTPAHQNHHVKNATTHALQHVKAVAVHPAKTVVKMNVIQHVKDHVTQAVKAHVVLVAKDLVIPAVKKLVIADVKAHVKVGAQLHVHIRVQQHVRVLV